MIDVVKDDETEATQSSDLKINNDTWLTTANKIYEWEKKYTTPNKLPTIEVSDTTNRNNATPPAITSPHLQLRHTTKIQCPSVHRRQRPHHDEDRVLFIVVYDYMGEIFEGIRSMGEVLRVA